jgi:hypothetical protein
VVDLMRNKVRIFTETRNALRELFAPTIEFRHAPSCIHGTAPSSIIQGLHVIYNNLYFKRRNVKYANALGELLDESAPPKGLSLQAVCNLEEREEG